LPEPSLSAILEREKERKKKNTEFKRERGMFSELSKIQFGGKKVLGKKERGEAT